MPSTCPDAFTSEQGHSHETNERGRVGVCRLAGVELTEVLSDDPDRQGEDEAGCEGGAAALPVECGESD